MVSVSIGVLSTPLPKDSVSAVIATLKKEFCRGIVLGQNVDKYTFALIASGQVTPEIKDDILQGVIVQMINSFIVYRKGE